MLKDCIIERNHFFGIICIYAGENEMFAFAEGGLKVLNGDETVRKY